MLRLRRRSKEYFQGLHLLALIDSEFESDFHQLLGYYKVKKSATLSKNFHQSKSMMTNHDDGLMPLMEGQDHELQDL